MGYVDIPLLLLSLAIVVAGQTFWTLHSRRRRAAAAIAQRIQYFKRLQVDCQKMTDEVEASIKSLELENARLEARLKEFDFGSDQILATDSIEGLEKVKSNLEQKKVQLKSLDDELTQIRSTVNLDEDVSPEDLAYKIRELQSENKVLESQLETLDKLVLPTRDTDMDPEIMEYLKLEGSKYALEQLDALYEKLLEEKVADPKGSLEAYEARIKSFDYEAEHQRLDVARKRVEKIYERERRLYLEDAKTFNETRIEYTFKIPAVREECNALEELNQIDEQALRNCRKVADAKPSAFDKSSSSWREEQENQYP